MENSIAFALYDGAFWLSIFIGALGIIAICSMIYFGHKMFTKLSHIFIVEIKRMFKSMCRCISVENINVANDVKAIVDFFTDYREKRNEFLSAYGQIILAIFVVMIIAILLITKTISTEAGLPILSAIAGFAIAKGVNPSKGFETAINPNEDN